MENKIIYMPGCSFYERNYPTFIKVFDYLKEIYSNQVECYRLCCGVISEPYNFEENLNFVDDSFIKKAKEAELIIINCPNCYNYYKNNIKDESIQKKIISIYEVLVDNYYPKIDFQLEKISIHDPCPSRYYANIHEAVRTLLKRVNFDIIEVDYTKNLTKCCGNGALIGFTSYKTKRKFMEERNSEFEYPIITYCSDCTRNLNKSSHLLEKIFL